MNYILARLTEPSTYSGLAAILAVLGVNVPPGVIQTLAFFGAAAAGVAAVVIKEGFKKAVEDGDIVKSIESVPPTAKV